MSRDTFVLMNPWAPAFVTAPIGLENIGAENELRSWEGLRTLALERAWQNTVPSIARILLSIFLFDDSVQRSAFFLCHYILTAPPGQATAYHNVASLQQMPPCRTPSCC